MRLPEPLGTTPTGRPAVRPGQWISGGRRSAVEARPTRCSPWRTGGLAAVDGAGAAPDDVDEFAGHDQRAAAVAQPRCPRPAPARHFCVPDDESRCRFDTFDLLVDLLTGADLSGWRWKDEAEYVDARRLGIIDDAEHAQVDAAREQALALLTERQARSPRPNGGPRGAVTRPDRPRPCTLRCPDPNPVGGRSGEAGTQAPPAFHHSERRRGPVRPRLRSGDDRAPTEGRPL